MNGIDRSVRARGGRRRGHVRRRGSGRPASAHSGLSPQYTADPAAGTTATPVPPRTAPRQIRAKRSTRVARSGRDSRFSTQVRYRSRIAYEPRRPRHRTRKRVAMPLRTNRRIVWTCGLSLAVAAGAAAQQPPLPPPTRAPFPRRRLPRRGRDPLHAWRVLAIPHQQHPQLGALAREHERGDAQAARGLGEVKRTASVASAFIIPDYEFRMQQSDLGIQAAMAEYWVTTLNLGHYLSVPCASKVPS